MSKESKSTRDKVYSSIVTMLEGMYDFHPDCLDGLPTKDRAVLSKYFFAGRPVDVDSIFEYRDQLIVSELDILERAKWALVHFYELHDMAQIDQELEQL